jgi:hypothetical protein
VGSIRQRSYPTDYSQEVDESVATGHMTEDIRKRDHGANARLLQGAPVVEAAQIHDGEHMSDQFQTLIDRRWVKSRDCRQCEMPWSI